MLHSSYCVRHENHSSVYIVNTFYGQLQKAPLHFAVFEDYFYIWKEEKCTIVFLSAK